MFPKDTNLSSGECHLVIWKNINLQGPGNQNRTNVAAKANIDNCSCGTSWYNKRYKRIFTTNSWKGNSNRNPENCTNKHSTYSEKSVFVWDVSIKLIPVIYLQLLFM